MSDPETASKFLENSLRKSSRDEKRLEDLGEQKVLIIESLENFSLKNFYKQEVSKLKTRHKL